MVKTFKPTHQIIKIIYKKRTYNDDNWKEKFRI